MVNRSLLIFSFFIIAYACGDENQIPSLNEEITIRREDHLKEFLNKYKLCSQVAEHPPMGKEDSRRFVFPARNPFGKDCQSFINEDATEAKVIHVKNENGKVYPVIIVKGNPAVPHRGHGNRPEYHKPYYVPYRKSTGTSVTVTPLIFALYKPDGLRDYTLKERLFASLIESERLDLFGTNEIVQDNIGRLETKFRINEKEYWYALLLNVFHKELKKSGCSCVVTAQDSKFCREHGYRSVQDGDHVKRDLYGGCTIFNLDDERP